MADIFKVYNEHRIINHEIALNIDTLSNNVYNIFIIDEF